MSYKIPVKIELEVLFLGEIFSCVFWPKKEAKHHATLQQDTVREREREGDGSDRSICNFLNYLLLCSVCVKLLNTHTPVHTKIPFNNTILS